jgi:hypothetical protein
MRTSLHFLSGVESLHLWYGASHREDQAQVKDLGAVMWGPLTAELPEPPAEEE